MTKLSSEEQLKKWHILMYHNFVRVAKKCLERNKEDSYSYFHSKAEMHRIRAGINIS